MSRRLILLAGLSLAAILMTSFVLLQGRADYVSPKFPSPWSSSDSKSQSQADKGSESSWLSQHIDEYMNHNGPSDEPEPFHDPHNKAPSDALADPPTAADESTEEHQVAAPQEDLINADAPATAPDSQDSEPTSAPHSVGNGTVGTGVVAPSSGIHHSNKPISVHLTEMGGSHDEVVAALVYAFGRQPQAEMTLWMKRPRYGITNIFKQFDLSHRLPNHRYKEEFKRDWSDEQPNIVLSTTCEFDAPDFAVQWEQLLNIGNTYLFCVFHHADRWSLDKPQTQKVLPWVKAGLVTFIALSRHTREFMEKESEKWLPETDGVKAKVRYLVPVFPVDLDNVNTAKEKPQELAFALQGDYHSSRRDYKNIFGHLNDFLNSASGTSDGSHIQLHLIGHGQRPEVPRELSSHVSFDEGLSYLSFYGLLSRQFALLPAFASREYLDRKASSSVPAALIAGVPLVATQEILDAYSYVPADAVWLQEEGEDDFDVVSRVIYMSAEERAEKKKKVQEANLKRMEINEGLVGEWIREGMAAVRARQGEDSKTTAGEKSASTDDAPLAGVGSDESDKTSSPDTGSEEDDAEVEQVPYDDKESSDGSDVARRAVRWVG